MNIGLDLDGIFVSLPPFVPRAIIDWLYKGRDHGPLYRIPPKPEQIIRIISHHPFLRPPIINNIKLIKNLTKDKKHNYYLISSRFSFLKKQTELIVKRYQLDKTFADMFFNFKDQQPHIFKDQTIKKLEIKLYVDDDLLLLRFLAKSNSKTKFFWLNKELKKSLTKNLFAIKNLSEIFK